MRDIIRKEMADSNRGMQGCCSKPGAVLCRHDRGSALEFMQRFHPLRHGQGGESKVQYSSVESHVSLSPIGARTL